MKVLSQDAWTRRLEAQNLGEGQIVKDEHQLVHLLLLADESEVLLVKSEEG